MSGHISRPSDIARAELAIAWVTLFVIGTDLFVVSPLLPLIAAGYGISPATSGLSVTSFALSYAVSAPVFGSMADRLGRRRILCWCLIGFGAANLLSGLAETFEGFVAARILAGSMAAGVSPSVYALVGDAAPPGRRGTWMAIAVSGVLLSLTLGAPLGGLAGAWLGSSPVFAAFGPIAGALLWANQRVWPVSNPIVAARDAILPSVARMAPRLAVTVLWSTALYGMYTYLAAGLNSAGYAADQIAALIFLYGLGAVIGTLIGGYLADRQGPAPLIGLSLACVAAAFLGLRLGVATGQLIAPALCLTSAAAQLFFPAQQASLAATFPAWRATALAWNNASLFLGISIGSLIGAQAVAFGGFSLDIAVSAAIAVTAWLVHSVVGTAAGRRIIVGGRA